MQCKQACLWQLVEFSPLQSSVGSGVNHGGVSADAHSLLDLGAASKLEGHVLITVKPGQTVSNLNSMHRDDERAGTTVLQL